LLKAVEAFHRSGRESGGLGFSHHPQRGEDVETMAVNQNDVRSPSRRGQLADRHAPAAALSSGVLTSLAAPSLRKRGE